MARPRINADLRGQARTVLDIPVPILYGWSGRADNVVGAEYILMEEARGTEASYCWDKLAYTSKLAIMEELVTIQNKFLSHSFTQWVRRARNDVNIADTFPHSYGNLYYANDAVEGAVPAELCGEGISSNVREEVAANFSIGPVVDERYWMKERAGMDIDRGPCTLLQCGELLTSYVLTFYRVNG